MDKNQLRSLWVFVAWSTLDIFEVQFQGSGNDGEGSNLNKTPSVYQDKVSHTMREPIH